MKNTKRKQHVQVGTKHDIELSEAKKGNLSETKKRHQVAMLAQARAKVALLERDANGLHRPENVRVQ